MSGTTRQAEVIVVGGGQAGMAAGYYLAQAGIRFLILDAGARAGHAWAHRWDTLELFTPARYSSLPGMVFPGSTAITSYRSTSLNTRPVFFTRHLSNRTCSRGL